MARKLMVDLESKAFTDSIPQPPTRRNWRAMILSTDEEASYVIKNKLIDMAVLSVVIRLPSKNTLDYTRASEAFESFMLCDLSCKLEYQPDMELFSDSTPETLVKIYRQAEHTEETFGLSQVFSGFDITSVLARLKTAEKDALLVILLVGAFTYFDSARSIGNTPFGYLSPQMLYVVCKLIGLKVRSLD